ncbi:MAG TPA: winged helix-turn-helix domain-containing protein [Trebonia sp.]
MLTAAGTPADRVTGLSLELDPLHRTVTRDGQQIHLSPKEFAVLEALLKAAPAALSAEDLLGRVWDETPTRSPEPSRSPSVGCAAS